VIADTREFDRTGDRRRDRTDGGPAETGHYVQVRA
jgi:hypothetical protein